MSGKIETPERGRGVRAIVQNTPTQVLSITRAGRAGTPHKGEWLMVGIEVRVRGDVVEMRGVIRRKSGPPLATEWHAYDQKNLQETVNKVVEAGRKRYEELKQGGIR